MSQIRIAIPADAAAIAQVSVDTWRSAYAGIVPAEFLANLVYAERAERMRHHLATATSEDGFFLVAESDHGDVIGFASGGAERSGTQPACGELYTLYVHPTHQQQGIGRQLMAASVQQLSQMGLTSLVIWTLAANPSRRFYARLGGKLVNERTTEIGGATLPEVCYGWETLNALRIDA